MEQKSLLNLEFDKILAMIASGAGSRAARETLLATQPSTSSSQIKTWLDEVEELLACLQGGLKINIGGIRDLREILELLKAGTSVLGSDDFIKVKANIEVALNLKKNFDSRDNAWLLRKDGRLTTMIRNMPSLGNIYHRIDDCIDERGVIRSDASPTLAGIRREFSKTVSETEKKLNAFLNSHADDLQDRYFTLRNDRYVVPIVASAQSRIQGIIHDQSATGQTVFIEPLAFLPLNNRLAQLRLSERDEIRKIFTSLTAMLAGAISDLAEQFEVLIYLDMLKAKAHFAIKYNAAKPDPATKPELQLKNARHPMLHPDCVPLDISLNRQQRCIIITGPNGGGKTVALKTVGVNALLMQTGNYVLADSHATLPIFKHVLSDIGESQSIEDHLSTFTAHLKRLREICNLANDNSLVLIDEICVGTDPIEGGALASGFLKELANRGAFCVVTSHYDSLKQVAFTTPGFINAAMEFDYETFKPTFRFQLGIPGKSNALAMARSFGLPETILADLIEVNEGQKINEKGLVEAIERERNRAEALRRTYVQKINSIRSKEKEIEQGMEQLREFRKSRRDTLTEEYTAQLKKRLREIESIINRLRQSATENDKARQKEITQAKEAHKMTRQTMQNLQKQPKDPAPHKMKVDLTPQNCTPGMDIVWKRNLAQGTLVYADFNKKRAEIDINGKKLVIALNEIAPATKRKKSKKEASGVVYAVAPYVRNEIDLRGTHVEEAVEKVETILKTLANTDVDKAYIIHGKGTGALQRAITGYLHNSPWRKKFRPGKYGEGDQGVTIIEF